MGFMDSIRRLFGRTSSPSASKGDPYGVFLHFECGRCGARVRIRADRRTDFNREDDGAGSLVLRKDVMDDRCFQLMHAEIWLDERYQVVAADVIGGRLLGEDEVEKENEAGPAVDS
ncbi:MAG: hypothetical protein ACOX9A_11805 [Anaerolineae bacterium]|jgi:hypothetical protein